MEGGDAESNLDITIVQEDSIDESQASTEDLNYTLQEEMALRKNLEATFADVEIKPQPSTSVLQKIAHFERKLAENKKEHQKPPPVPGRVTEAQKQHNKRLNVFLRIRPCAKPEDSVMEVVEPDNAAKQPHPTKIRTQPHSLSSQAATTAAQGNVKNNAREYEFSQVFGPGMSQTQVYERSAAPLVSKLCSGNRVGESALLFSYGITGGGKTHTVLGDVRSQNNNEWGIVPRCLSQVLQKVANTDLKVFLSFFEIYNENVFDLLPAAQQKKALYQVNLKPLKIRERRGQTVIKGLSKHQIQSLDQALSIVRKANESRHTATNHLNRHSSRSHCVCQITVKPTSELQAPPGDDSSVDTATLIDEDSATLWIVDLAGSERSKRTNVGSLRLKEASHINKSLMTLMGCLTRGEKNFRDSKLTVLFMHHWMKHGPTSMIVNVHPSQDDYDETQHVLAYAISTKTIPNFERNESALASAASGQTKVEYDYNGRRKNPVNESTSTLVLRSARNGTARPAVEKPATKKPSRTGRVKFASQRGSKKGTNKPTKEIPPPSRAHANPGRKRKQEAAQVQAETKAANVKKEAAASSNKKQRVEVPDLQKELSLARAEIEMLKAKNKKLSRQMETTETAVRAEVAEEMLAEMGAIRERYEETIAELKSKVAVSTAVSEKREKLDRAERKIGELLEKIDECEEEMERMTEAHAAAQKLAQETVESKNNEILGLRKDLSDYQQDISRLEKSKEELIRNYEQLLGDGTDSEVSGMDHDGDDCKKEPTTFRAERVKCATEPRPRRRLAINGTNGDTAAKPSQSTTPAKIPSMNRSAFTQPKAPKETNTNQDNATLSAVKARKPLGFLQVNVSANPQKADDGAGVSKYLYPKKKAKLDPETGAFLRPRGRAPVEAREWDEAKGAWTTTA